MKDERDNKEKGQFLPFGMCIGLSVGTAIGAALNNISLYMCIGLSIGVGIGALLDSRNQKNNNDTSE